MKVLITLFCISALTACSGASLLGDTATTAHVSENAIELMQEVSFQSFNVAQQGTIALDEVLQTPANTQKMSISLWSRKTEELIAENNIINIRNTSALTYQTGGVELNWEGTKVSASLDTANEWHHFLIVFDISNSAEEVMLYIDGNLEISINAGAAPLDYSDDELIISENDGINGVIDLAELAVWEEALTSEQAAELFDNDPTFNMLEFSASNLRSYWNMSAAEESGVLVIVNDHTDTNALTVSDVIPVAAGFPSGGGGFTGGGGGGGCML